MDVHRIVGRGPEAFERAARGLLDWEMHRRAGITVRDGGGPGAGPLAHLEQDRITGRYLDALRDLAAGR